MYHWVLLIFSPIFCTSLTEAKVRQLREEDENCSVLKIISPCDIRGKHSMEDHERRQPCFKTLLFHLSLPSGLKKHTCTHICTQERTQIWFIYMSVGVCVSLWGGSEYNCQEWVPLLPLLLSLRQVSCLHAHPHLRADILSSHMCTVTSAFPVGSGDWTRAIRLPQLVLTPVVPFPQPRAIF